MQCPTCDSTVNSDDLHCNAAGQEYCENCHVDAEMWLFGSVMVSKEQVCESCMVVPVADSKRYCIGCINDIVTYLAASYIATEALYMMHVEDKYNELLLSSEYGGNYGS